MMSSRILIIDLTTLVDWYLALIVVFIVVVTIQTGIDSVELMELVNWRLNSITISNVYNFIFIVTSF